MGKRGTVMTPTPWNISPVRTTEDTAMIVGGEGFEFGLIADVTEDDDAALIVNAVNNHDALMRRVAALELIIAEEVNPFNCRDDLNRMLVEEICNRIPGDVSEAGKSNG